MIRCSEKTEVEKKMEDDGDFIVLKNAILLNRREVAAREWRNFILENWQKLTEHLENATILMIHTRRLSQNITQFELLILMKTGSRKI